MRSDCITRFLVNDLVLAECLAVMITTAVVTHDISNSSTLLALSPDLKRHYDDARSIFGLHYEIQKELLEKVVDDRMFEHCGKAVPQPLQAYSCLHL
ncbi:hypothetical protein BASA61_001145 [Batrachochytrium salamandrivorans]|nr:hypothetical protein BASA61_001145 [Batrachochytrium salamandrivorans]